MPIANKLSTLKKCLKEVLKYGGDGLTGRDLYPYQLALAQIDHLRIDGKFKGKDGTIPEGQAILNANLGEWSVLLLLPPSPPSSLRLVHMASCPAFSLAMNS